MNRREAELPRYDAVPPGPAAATERDAPLAHLERALSLSREIEMLIERGEVRRAQQLDAERRALLVSIRPTLRPLTPAAAAMLAEIAERNDHAIGRLEHRRRSIGRELDLVAVGRRALRAYSRTP